MSENYKLNKVFDGMKRDSIVGRSLGLEKKRNLVRGIMEKQGISVDPSKLAGYKKEKFLRAIDGQIGLGYYDKKAFQSAYGEKKTKSTKIEMNKKPFALKGKNENSNRPFGNFEFKIRNNQPEHEKAKVLNFAVSDKYIRSNESLVHGTSIEANNRIATSLDVKSSDQQDNVRNALKRIQS